MESLTRINIARQEKHSPGKYYHFFRVELNGPFISEGDLVVINDLKTKYPAPEFNITITRFECRGKKLEDL